MLNPKQPPSPTGRFDWERLMLDFPCAPTVKLLALVLATFANSKTGGSIHPGIERLAEITGLSGRTVIRCLKELEEQELVECVQRGSSLGRGGKGRASLYRLTVPSEVIERGIADGWDEPEHVTRVSPNEMPEQVTLTTDQVTPATDQVTYGAGSSDTGVTPSIIKQQPEITTIKQASAANSPRARETRLLAQHDDGSSAYDKARHHLGNLGPDRSDHYMDQARQALGTDAALRERVIHAATLAGWQEKAAS